MGVTISDRIRTKLAALEPLELDVVDQSEAHRGHAGWRDGGETHFDLRVVSAAFEGLSRVQRQRLVLDALKEEFDAGLHALSIKARAPGE
ncbi:MAG: BolA family protein [Alphaproteobacteria bacterium]|jgi:BolA protein